VRGEAGIPDVACSSSEHWFDQRECDRAIFFIQEFCRHVKGPLAGERLRLEPWQKDVTSKLFGWRRANGLRRYRYVWLEVPRKAGKSTFAAAIGLYMLMVDPEPGAEIVIAAANAEHANVCFNIARDMINGDPDLEAVCKVHRRGIAYKDAYLHVVSSRHETIHGRNISCLLFDDVYLQTGRDLHDALITSMAARSQPLTLYVTSAGRERSSLAWELHEYAAKVKAGLVDDPAWLVSIFGANAEDDWTNPEVWRKSHPGIGVSVSEEFIRQECRRAQQTPGFIGSFRQLYLNVWAQESSRWLDMEKWDRCGDSPVDPAGLAGRECRAGLDLSTTTDLSALVLVFRDEDGGYTLLPFAFCPADRILERQRRDRVDYGTWRERRLLIATEGNTVDHEAIRRKIHELARTYRIRELAYDRWNSSMLINQLVNDGLNCVPVAQSNGAMNAPARELERVIAAGMLRHGANPILRWCAGNAIAHVDASGDIRPSKSRSIERIDLLVAALMGISRHLVAPSLMVRQRRGWARVGDV
jgi:phage terminase large subunit-like protein